MVAWVRAHLQVGCASIDEPGRVFFADDSAEHSILVERMLVPIFIQVPRNGHAERRALISVLRAVARAFDYDHQEGWEDVQGLVELFVSHYPCISCLAAVAQFARCLSQARLQVEFDDAWASWSERPMDYLPPDGLAMGRSA